MLTDIVTFYCFNGVNDFLEICTRNEPDSRAGPTSEDSVVNCKIRSQSDIDVQTYENPMY